jgi:hypothetical protein
MNAPRFVPTLLFLAVFAVPAHAGGRWVLRAGGGEAISGTHGSALEASLVAEAKPDLWLGLETGVCKMKLESAPPVPDGVVALGGGLSHVAAGLTDGITRDRVIFFGPTARWGSSVYAVVSYGMADVRTGASGTTDYLQGGSVGVGVGGSGRFEPSAEMRVRWVSDAFPGRAATATGSALTFTVGLHIR